jgi:hypothetical protein
MRRPAFLSLLLTVVTGAVACDSVAGPEPLPLTLQASAAPAVGADLPVLSYQITNTGRSELFLGSCNQQILVAVERDENGSWVNASGGYCQMNADMTPISIAPGATLQGTRVYDGSPGRYRVLAYGYRHWTDTSGVTLVSTIIVVEH